ncbi:MAG: tellurite resistance-related uncharacterized protein [Arenicella sp.]|jgi:tellurite resistance-related uncharacterized protein
MKKLPNTVSAYKKTPEFTELTVPKGLLKDHQTKQDVWGEIVVLEGCLEYTIIEPALEVITLNKGQRGVVEPTILHHVTPVGAVRFYVEFNR